MSGRGGVPPFLGGGGEAGALIRGLDWDASPLGPPTRWPEALRTLVGIMLGSLQPMFVAWGEERIILYNDGYAPILGLRHPSAMGRRFDDVWPEILDDVGPILDRAYAGEGTQMDDIALRMTRSGYEEETHFSFSYTPVRDETGTIAGMFCACQETTERVMTERRRSADIARLQQLFDRAPGLIAVLSGPDHRFEMVNESYLQLVGHRDLIGRTVREALPEVAGQGFFDLLDEVYESGEPYTGRGMRVMLRTRLDTEPQEKLVDFVYQPIAEPSGEISGIFVEGYDVTERHLAEEALRESEERFRLIADSAPVPMWVTRLDRKRSFVNRAYVDFLGIGYDEAVDFDWRTIIHPDDGARVLAESLAGEASLERFTLEGRYRRGDGEWRWLRSVSQPRWGPEGEHAGFIGVAHDITDSKEAEAALRRINDTLEQMVEERTSDLTAALDRLQAEVAERQRAEEALRQAQKMEAVGQLTGGIAHDFNNLLTPIMGGLEFIAGRTEDARLKRIAETGLESARRGAKLTGQLLAFSRTQRISMTPTPVNDVISNMRDLLRHTIGRDIVVETRLDGKTGLAMCDANQLENAILNLAINARDAMPRGGTLTIETGRARIEAAPDLDDGDYVRIAIADTGEGMTPDILARATEPFFSTKPPGKGTGLGLAQVYGIAHQAGGTLRIDSEEGSGTTVHLFFPAADAVGERPLEENAGVAFALSRSGAGASILVVDDDEDVRSFLAGALEDLGYCVAQAENGEAALALLSENRPDLMLADFAMPGMNGADVARAARERHPGLPVVLVTGYAETDRIEALGDEVPVLRKPFGGAELAAIVAANI